MSQLTSQRVDPVLQLRAATSQVLTQGPPSLVIFGLLPTTSSLVRPRRYTSLLWPGRRRIPVSLASLNVERWTGQSSSQARPIIAFSSAGPTPRPFGLCEYPGPEHLKARERTQRDSFRLSSRGHMRLLPYLLLSIQPSAACHFVSDDNRREQQPGTPIYYCSAPRRALSLHPPVSAFST